MKKIRNRGIFFLVIMFLLLACSKKGTRYEIKYREPVSFDIFKQFEDAELPSEYVNFCKEIWNNELKDDKEIKENTWKKGDYTVFVYLHDYISSMVGVSYNELIFFTTTRPVGKEKMIYSTITPFEFEYYPDHKVEKIKTYIFVNDYNPIESEEEAKQLMKKYLDEYAEKYKDDKYTNEIIEAIKWHLEYWDYTWEYTDHSVFLQPPVDFGGSIIVNKQSSILDFLGSSIWMGTGQRYFPID